MGIAAEFGKAELEFVTSITAPIFWVIRDARGLPRSGSAFFLDAGKGPFGVTAQHVIAKWRTDHCSSNVEALKINVYFSGFPGTKTCLISSDEFLFDAAAGHGFVSDVNEKNVSNLIERASLIGVLGKGVPPEHYDFRGLSGGPMLTVIERDGLDAPSQHRLQREGRQNVTSLTPSWRIASAIDMPWPCKTSACRNRLTISSGL